MFIQKLITGGWTMALSRILWPIAIMVCATTTMAASGEPADLIIINAKITTQNPGQPETQALAVRDGRIIFTGSDKETLAYQGHDSRIVDAHQRRVIPGLNDSHLHATRGGRFYNLELRWEGVKSLKTALAMISEQAKRTPKGQWVRVIGGWSPFQFEEKRMPTVEELNEAAPDTPVFILFLYSRGLLNQAGLKALGIDKTTSAPTGGKFEVDQNGDPTGLLIADPSPVILYQTIAKLPQLSESDQINSTRQFYRHLNRFGLTSVIDAGGGGHQYPENYTGSLTLAKQGDLPLRISHYLFPQHMGNELADFNQWLSMTYPGDNPAKNLAHGLETEGGGEFLVWSAGDYENFMSPRPVQSDAMEPQLEAAVRLLVSHRWPFRLHATYGESADRILNVLEKVNQTLPFDGLRWALDHCETLTQSELVRIQKLGGGVAIQDRMAFAGEYFKQRYGEAAASNAPPLKMLLHSGVPLGAGTDATRVSSFNPWVSLYWMISGKSVGGEPLLSEANQLSRADALRLYTLGSAWFSAEEDQKGRIAPGQFADFALLSEDYFTVQEEAIPDIESLVTVVNGQIVYAQGDYAELGPAPQPASPAWSPVNYD